MKKLQSNYTTPEQSKRLLELGVPEWTANCVLRHYNWADDNLDERNWELPCIVWDATDLDRFIDDEYDKVLPCWSVGRLMEIYALCCPTDIDADIWLADSDTYLNSMIAKFESAFEDSVLDFSKLEED